MVQANVVQSDYFNLLTPRSKIDLMNNLSKACKETFKDHLNEVKQAKKDTIQASSDNLFTQWYTVNTGQLEKLRNSAGASQEEIDSILNNINTSIASVS